MIKISDQDIRKAAANGVDDFLKVFTDAYWKEINGEINAESMTKLNGHQNALLAYSIFRNEMNDGGFVQMIQNGYGGYFFDNPFAKAMRLFGAKPLSKLVYAAKKIYDSNKKELERETSEEEFLSMYVDFEEFDDLEEEFFFMEEETTSAIAHFVDENIELFAEIV
ncbi:MAG: DMP19 family protein [Paludibacteraceae bacterium]|nr:DMP19 family protein [Paludibacteraceae bacterium]MBO7636968.1 DMP19 family protein [Paludibacteraceae bacterium]MBR5972398.1 DMP19 family protein [Paludibacteraceae bacterium]